MLDVTSTTPSPGHVNTYGAATGSTTPMMLMPAAQQSPSKSLQEIWGPPILTLFGVLIAVIVPLIFKWRGDRRERRLSLEREIYVEVVDAMTEAGESLTAMVAIDANSYEVSKRLSASLGVISRAEVVAPIDLVIALSELQQMLATFTGGLMASRAAIDKATIRIGINDKWIEKYHADIEENIDEQNAINIKGAPIDDGRLARLRKRFEELRGVQAQYFESNKQDHAQRVAGLKELSLQMLRMKSQLAPCQANVLGLIRRELALTKGFDKARYLSMKQQSSHVAEQFVRETTEKVQRAFMSEFEVESSQKDEG